MTHIKDTEYKPHLAKDKEYIKGIAESIKGKKVEDIKFYLLDDALNALGFSESPYVLVNLDSLTSGVIEDLVNKVFEKINNIQLSQEVLQKLYNLWDYLAEEDPLEKADLIFVFGGKGAGRAKEAAKLYKEGWASKILFTGKQASYMPDVKISEAEYYAQVAQEEGVPLKDIILEKEAKNTPENVVNSVKILKSMNWLPAKIITIQTKFQTRRAYHTFKAASDWNPKLIRHPVQVSSFGREDYFKDKNGWSYVFFEYIKLYGARLMGHF